jgi:hypothetical protein
MAKTVGPRVSDHAVLRYIERVMGVDVEQIRRGLLTPLVRQAMIAGAKQVTIEGVTFVIDNQTLVTVVEKQRSSRLVRQVPLRKGSVLLEDAR